LDAYDVRFSIERGEDRRHRPAAPFAFLPQSFLDIGVNGGIQVMGRIHR
jgi:hypothetical protein